MYWPGLYSFIGKFSPEGIKDKFEESELVNKEAEAGEGKRLGREIEGEFDREKRREGNEAALGREKDGDRG
jgi:hypothetical protein